jgi:hypothetical protein
MRTRASSQLASASSPFLRTRAFSNLSSELFACQPKRSLESTWPLLTRSTPSAAHADDASFFDRHIQGVTVGVEYGGRLHPVVHVVGDPFFEKLIHPHGPCFAWTERRAFAPALLYAVGPDLLPLSLVYVRLAGLISDTRTRVILNVQRSVERAPSTLANPRSCERFYLRPFA